MHTHRQRPVRSGTYHTLTQTYTNTHSFLWWNHFCFAWGSLSQTSLLFLQSEAPLSPPPTLPSPVLCSIRSPLSSEPMFPPPPQYSTSPQGFVCSPGLWQWLGWSQPHTTPFEFPMPKDLHLCFIRAKRHN